MIRAIRFSSKLGFSIDENTLKSIYKNAYIIKNISIERINDEFTKNLVSDNTQNIILLYKTKILENLGTVSYTHLFLKNVTVNMIYLTQVIVIHIYQ